MRHLKKKKNQFMSSPGRNLRTTVFLREKTLHLTKTTNSSKLLNHEPTEGSHPSGKENPSNEPGHNEWSG